MKCRIALAVAAQARGAVGQVALVLLLADREADVGLVGQAVHALAALGREERDHVIAGREARHALAHGLDHARALVAQHGRRVAGGIGAARGVHVGVADAAGGQPDEHLARPRPVQLDVLDHERLSELLEHGRADLHCAGPYPLASRSCHTAGLSRHDAPSTDRPVAIERNERRNSSPPRFISIRRCANRRSCRAPARGRRAAASSWTSVLTGYAIRHRIRVGRLHVLHRGVYAVGHRVVSSAARDIGGRARVWPRSRCSATERRDRGGASGPARAPGST